MPSKQSGCYCPQCGYDLRGQIVERCPECGFHYDAPAVLDIAMRAYTYCVELYLVAVPVLVAGSIIALVALLNEMAGLDRWKLLVAIGFSVMLNRLSQRLRDSICTTSRKRSWWARERGTGWLETLSSMTQTRRCFPWSLTWLYPAFVLLMIAMISREFAQYASLAMLVLGGYWTLIAGVRYKEMLAVGQERVIEHQFALSLKRARAGCRFLSWRTCCACSDCFSNDEAASLSPVRVHGTRLPQVNPLLSSGNHLPYLEPPALLGATFRAGWMPPGFHG